MNLQWLGGDLSCSTATRLLRIVLRRGAEQSDSSNGQQLPWIKSVRFSDRFGVVLRGEPWTMITTCFPNVTGIEAWKSNVSADDLKTAVGRLPAMRRLKLWLGKSNAGNASLEAVLAQCRELKVLAADGSEPITGCIGSHVQSTSLYSLSLRCSGLTDDGLAALASACPNITELDASCCQEFTDKGLETIGRAWGRRLVSLVVEGCRQITDQGFIGLAEALKQHSGKCVLQMLDAMDCNNIQDGLSALAEVCPDLRKLYVNRCEKVGLRHMEAVAKHCPLLEELQIQEIDNIDSDCVIQHVSKLSKLTLLYANKGPKLNWQAVRALGQGCPALKKVSMGGRLSSDTVPLFFSFFANLRVVSVWDCSLNDMILTTISQFPSCSRLTVLGILSNPYITGDGIEALTACCPMLEKLHTYKCPKLTDRSLASIAAHCPMLQELDFSRRNNITVDGLTHLHACYNLRRLEATDHPSLTDDNRHDYVPQLVAACPFMMEASVIT